jgi:hypothetical protein
MHQVVQTVSRVKRLRDRRVSERVKIVVPMVVRWIEAVEEKSGEEKAGKEKA